MNNYNLELQFCDSQTVLGYPFNYTDLHHMLIENADFEKYKDKIFKDHKSMVDILDVINVDIRKNWDGNIGIDWDLVGYYVERFIEPYKDGK